MFKSHFLVEIKSSKKYIEQPCFALLCFAILYIKFCWRWICSIFLSEWGEWARTGKMNGERARRWTEREKPITVAFGSFHFIFYLILSLLFIWRRICHWSRTDMCKFCLASALANTKTHSYSWLPFVLQCIWFKKQCKTA